MVYEFLAHTSPGKSRIYALVRGSRNRLDAITTLGAADLHLTDELVENLNTFLATRDIAVLRDILDQLPNPVRMAVSQFVETKCTPEMGAFTSYGPVDVVREAVYFSRVDEEFEEYLSGAYMIGLGIRVTNERAADGEIGWMVQLLSDEVSVPHSAELRTWALPDDVKILTTWNSAHAAGGPVHGALQVARDASEDGNWVRIHSLLHGNSDVDFEGSGTSELVVDVFDSPIPAEEPDEGQ